VHQEEAGEQPFRYVWPWGSKEEQSLQSLVCFTIDRSEMLVAAGVYLGLSYYTLCLSVEHSSEHSGSVVVLETLVFLEE
jgi:hypothetical protein